MTISLPRSTRVPLVCAMVSAVVGGGVAVLAGVGPALAITAAALCGTGAWDAWTGRIPNAGLLVGLAAAIGGIAMNGGGQPWGALAVLVGLWGLREIWHLSFGSNGIGLGDVKWLALSVFVFSEHMMLAFTVAVWSALLWKLATRQSSVRFGPFLAAGLIGALAMAASSRNVPPIFVA